MSFIQTLKSHYPKTGFDDSYNGIELDSRKVKPGFVFIAARGSNQDGWDFIDSTVENGARLVITNSIHWKERSDITVVYDQELVANLGNLAASFYNWPCKKLGVFGITGTNGKTSVSLFTAQLVTLTGHPCGYVGTNGYGLLDQIKPLINTTPDIIELNKILSEMVDSGAEYCAIEVSSHGLDQGRLSGIEFISTCFTNLSRDHLDYHGTMENYGKVKSKLFLDFKTPTSLINIDDDFGLELIRNTANKAGTLSYSTHDFSADVTARNIQYLESGVKFEISSPWGSTNVSVPLFGEFNVQNLTASLGMVLSLGIDIGQLIRPLEQLIPVSGRMEFIANKINRAIVIDYAHTPDALEKALIAIQQHCKGSVWVVFGCGGDRDKGKRPLMASVAEKFADSIIVTDDNPRTEKSSSIMADIKPGFSEKVLTSVFFEPDRALAIQFALKQSSIGDAVLVAGKGHEDYQVVGQEILPFSDQLVVRQVLENFL